MINSIIEPIDEANGPIAAASQLLLIAAGHLPCGLARFKLCAHFL